MKVKFIPATADSSAGPAGKRPGKKRVAAYCRVSTELEEQEGSYEAQIRHYREFIEANPDWELAGVYADEGITGTSTKRREQFNAMIADCEAGKIDMVITKSISRFARNTLDCLSYIRKLKALDIPILFEKENINTMDDSGELLLTIMASLAQQESASISQNVRMGIQYRFQQGKPKLNYTRFLGYTKVKGIDALQIVPEEAEIIRRIFRDFLDGMTLNQIVRELEREQIRTATGKTRWHNSSVYRILKNEKFMGDLLLQKYMVKDFLSKKRIRNDGILPQYYVENAHEPIVPKEIFHQAQAEFLRRAKVQSERGRAAYHGNGTALKGTIVCEKCGSLYRRTVESDAEGTENPSWRGRKYGKMKIPCRGRIVSEREVENAVVTAFNELPSRREELIRMLNRLEPTEDLRSAIKKLEAEEKRICEGNRLEQIREEKEALAFRKAERDMRYRRIHTLLALVDQIEGKLQPEPPETPPSCSEYADFMTRTEKRREPGAVTRFRDEDVVRYIEKIIVCEERLDVLFKAGIRIAVGNRESDSGYC